MRKKVKKAQDGMYVRLPKELREPLEALSATTGRTITMELTIAAIRHLTTPPEASPVTKLPPDFVLSRAS